VATNLTANSVAKKKTPTPIWESGNVIALI
jgi:hypothetical protein